MAEGSSGAVWFGAPGFEVLEVTGTDDELVVEVQTTATVVGCSWCGTRAKAKDRRWVTLRDAPVGDVAVRVRWHKRVWACPQPDCAAKTWTERSDLAGPRRVLTARAEVWATNRVAAVEGTPASIARGFGVSWSTVWAAVQRVGSVRVNDPARPGPGRAGRDGRLRRDRDATRASASSPATSSRGTVRSVYPGTDWPDEVARTGELYFFQAGHTLVYDEPSNVIEINPAAALATLMHHVDGVLATWSSGTADDTR